MGIIKASKENQAGADEADRSIYVSNVRIDRSGRGWTRKSIWIRQEHLGKLKAIAHFEGKESENLIDEALTEYISKRWDNSIAVKKLVQQSASRHKKQ
ncbi:MAG: hypothetical protein JSV44_01240 [Candidatus Zixiibacteriota bacterium]|nr:MAG: hypothetical protein JSV44_01240 [candidate division Zixibacteria bacterium]